MHLLARHGDRVDISTATVVEALQRNFGGLPSSDFHQVVPAFLEQLRKACGPHKFPNPKPEDFKPTLEVLTASLDETGHSYIEQHAALSDKSARPKLIIDYTGVMRICSECSNWGMCIKPGSERAALHTFTCNQSCLCIIHRVFMSGTSQLLTSHCPVFMICLSVQ